MYLQFLVPQVFLVGVCFLREILSIPVIDFNLVSQWIPEETRAKANGVFGPVLSQFAEQASANVDFKILLDLVKRYGKDIPYDDLVRSVNDIHKFYKAEPKIKSLSKERIVTNRSIFDSALEMAPYAKYAYTGRELDNVKAGLNVGLSLVAAVAGNPEHRLVKSASTTWDQEIAPALQRGNTALLPGGEDDVKLHFDDSPAKPHQPRWTLVYQRTRQRMVLAIRGTAGYEDIVTDLDAKPSHWWWKFGSVHKGFNNAANYVLKSLERENFLMRHLKSYKPRELVITGHSYGASTALVLTMKMQRYLSKYRKATEHQTFAISAVTFAPAPCVSSTVAHYFRNVKMMSFMHDLDLIPRVSLRNVEEFLKFLGLSRDLVFWTWSDGMERRAMKLARWWSRHGLSLKKHAPLYIPGRLFVTSNATGETVYEVKKEHFDELILRTPPKLLKTAHRISAVTKVLKVIKAREASHTNK